MCSRRATVRSLAYTLSWEAVGNILVAVLAANREDMAEARRRVRRLLPQYRQGDGGLGQSVDSEGGEKSLEF